MPQALSMVYVHLVFSTKERRPFLNNRIIRSELHAFMGGISKQLDCPPIIIGGVEDHVHMLVRFGRNITQADLVKEIKRVSSVWIKERDRTQNNFSWQSGYGIFSVSVSRLQDVHRYIENQETHHQHVTFQDELRLFLQKHGADWDEQYVWD